MKLMFPIARGSFLILFLVLSLLRPSHLIHDAFCNNHNKLIYARSKTSWVHNFSPFCSGQRLFAFITTFAIDDSQSCQEIEEGRGGGERTVQETGYHCYNVVATTSHGRLRIFEMPTSPQV